MNYSKDNFSAIFDLYPEGIHNKYGLVTHPEHEFHRRFDLFTQGLLKDFDYRDAFLCGGSLFAMLDGSISEQEINGFQSDALPSAMANSDIDLFILRESTTEESLRKLLRVLNYFVEYTKRENLGILFVLRGLLVEVMIENKRRIQVLLTIYRTIEDCISNMSVLHLHMYFNGKKLYASDAAIDNIMRKETRMCRAPIKDTKIPQLISRGITPVGEILTTKMDSDFLETLQMLANIKCKLDTLQDIDTTIPYGNGLYVSRNVSDIVHRLSMTARAKWNEKRLTWLQNCRIENDIDLFDLSIRLPAPDILFRCAFFRIRDISFDIPNKLGDGTRPNKQMLKRRMLKIRSKSSPAIFMERNVTMMHPFVLNSPDHDTSIGRIVGLHSTDNLRFLERYFNRQGMFRFHDSISHVLAKDGTVVVAGNDPNQIHIINMESVVHVTFFITIHDTLESIMYFDIIELQLER